VLSRFRGGKQPRKELKREKREVEDTSLPQGLITVYVKGGKVRRSKFPRSETLVKHGRPLPVGLDGKTPKCRRTGGDTGDIGGVSQDRGERA